MKELKTLKFNKIWGYEIWLYSTIFGKETLFNDGKKPTYGPLVKIIKADFPLSVQVHPDDKFAKELENQKNGKSESWFILEANLNSELVLGLKNYDLKAIKKMLDNNEFEANLNKVPIKKGDFYNIEAGLVHGIGANTTVFEVQQPSEITYRYYDYNRLENGKLRKLHIEKALHVQKDIGYTLKPIKTDPLSFKNNVGIQIFSQKELKLYEDMIVVNFDDYSSYLGEKGDVIKFQNFALISL